MVDRYLIVGLGNPGRIYANTRHNIGFQAVEALAAAHRLAFTRRQSRALIADGLLADRRVILAKPQTYMNLSGESVRGLVDFFKIPLENLLVIVDDMDIPLGTLRIRQQGGSGGQKGLRSIIDHLGTQTFARMRIGIGRPFTPDEHILVVETLDRVVRAVDTWLQHGITIMMTRHNGTADEAARSTTSVKPSTPEPPES